MIMTEEQKAILDKLKNKFDVLWKEFCQFIPEAKDIVAIKDVTRFANNYARRYKSLCDSKQGFIKSPCLLDEFVSSWF